MKNRLALLAASSALLCCGCAPRAIPETSPPPASSSSSAAALEQLPSELSIPYFAQMTLSGTELTLDDVLLKNDAYTRYAIHYRSNGLKITGMLLIPVGKGPFPLVILNHGYIATSVYTSGRGLKREQDYLAREGFAVLHTDYRGHAGSDPSPMTEDVYDGNLEYAMDSANAILAVRAAHLPTIDARHVGMLGHSLGGGVTLAVLTGRPDLVDAAVLYAPVSSHVWDNFVRWRSERDEGDRTIEEFGTYEDDPATWDRLSPASFLDRIRAPILLFHGDKDATVPQAWSDHLAADLQAAGKDITYTVLPGEDHEFINAWPTFMRHVSAFFHERLLTAGSGGVLVH